jgi:hypothetical protein
MNQEIPKPELLERCGYATQPCGRKNALGKFRCHCGKEFITQIRRVRDKATKSCGCYRRAKLVERNKVAAVHNLSSHDLYHVWYEMVKRCTDRNSPSWNNYGARGIQVCREWLCLRTFISEVIDAIGPRPPEYELDRKDNNGHYRLGNVKWSTIKQQARNRRSNRLITANGETKCAAEWIEQIGIAESTFSKRIKRGLTGSDLVAPPKGKR